MNIFSREQLEKIVTEKTTLFWFRRDLRVHDNAGLYFALKENSDVLPVFIFDTAILDKLEDKEDRRVDFIHQSLEIVKNQLEVIGSTLLVLFGDPVEIYSSLTPKAVYTNHDYEPYAIQRDERIRLLLEKKSISFKSYKDHLIFEKNEILKDDGKPYTVFTPYSRKWKATLNKFYISNYPTEKYFQNLKKLKALPVPSLESIGFKKTNSVFPDRIVKNSVIEKYHEQRNFPAIEGTSRLSVHLRFGTVSIRTLAQIALKKNDVWLKELIWREFYSMILWHFPYVETHAFKHAYDRIEWRNDVQEFKNWCAGNTGYPIVDAGMRELNATGFMHNRVRMIVASFLTKHLLIDWRWGEAYFAQKLLDFDLASNNGGWQWASGSGCDSAPYFRIFNPALQTEKFDGEHKYIQKWVTNLNSSLYQNPIVEHKFARERVLRVYKDALAS